MNTDELIERMAQQAAPVMPLPPPAKRAMTWSAASALYLAALVGVLATVSGGAGVGSPAFWASQAAAVATGVLATAAAFASVVPAVTSRLSWWAAAGAVVWYAATLFAASSAQLEWSTVAAASHEWWCVGIIVVGGAPLAAGLVLMLRRGAPLSPARTAALAALATVMLANVGACLALPHANGAATFVWHGGVVLATVLLAAASGRLVFAWPHRGRT